MQFFKFVILEAIKQINVHYDVSRKLQIKILEVSEGTHPAAKRVL